MRPDRPASEEMYSIMHAHEGFFRFLKSGAYSKTIYSSVQSPDKDEEPGLFSM